MLSNFDFVTESFTFIAGKSSVPAVIISFRRCTPVVVSSDTPLESPHYDELLWSCDCNFVRGEDSLVRGLWSGRPFVWQIYRQADDAHVAKVEAFLGLLPSGPQVNAMRWWNRLPGASPGALPELIQAAEAALPGLPAAFVRRLATGDLASRLLAFASTLAAGEAAPEKGPAKL